MVLFALVSEALARATAALLDQDVELANQVIADDRSIDDRCEQLIGLLTERLAQAAAEPDGLEELVAELQIVSELERSADLAEHIARRTLQGLGGLLTPRSRGLIQRMSELAVSMWQAAAMAYKQRSRDMGFHLAEIDDGLDEMAANLVSSGVSQGMTAQVAVDLALIARFYERLGDHAVNLARRVDSMAAPRRLSVPPTWAAQRPRRSPAETAKTKRGGISRLWSRLKRVRLVPTDEGFFGLFVDAAQTAGTAPRS